MSKLHIYLFAFLFISNSAFSQGQPGEEGPPYYGLELPPYGSGREAFEAFEKEVEARKRAQPGYVPPLYENALDVINHGPSFQEGVILGYDYQGVEELKEIVFEDDPKYRDKRSPAIHALGIIHSVDPGSVSFDELKSLIVGVEQSESLSAGIRVDILNGGYKGLSYSKDSRAYDFLIKRVTGEIWADGEIPTTGYYVHGSKAEEVLITTAQSDAIRALSGINDPRIPAVLEKLRKETPTDKDYIHYAIPSGIYGKRDQRLDELRQAAHAKRLASLGIKGTNEESKAEEARATSHEVSEVVEVVEEASAPDLAIKESAEVVTVEPSEEPAEQSSNWWLWLIGAVVVVGGIGLVARRKS